MEVQFGILGPLELRVAGEEVALPRGRQRTLLALLLVHANEPVAVDRLIDALWGHAPPPAALGSLHNLVSALRKAFGEGRLVTRDGAYLLRVEERELDAWRFAALAAEGRAALAAGDAEGAARTFRDALSLWRGDAFDDLAYETAVAEEARCLDDARLTALEDRLEADLVCGRHADVLGEVARRTAEHPLRERLVGQHMLALYRGGRQADALSVYTVARRRLSEELGLEPGTELRRLHQAILEHDPALATAAAASAPAQAGEHALLARLRRRPRWLLAGAGTVLAVAVGGALLTDREPSSSRRLAIGGDSVVAVDPATNRVAAEVPLGGTPSSIATSDGAVWALGADSQTVTRIDAVTKRRDVFAVGATPTDLSAETHALWVAAGTADPADIGVGATRLIRLDPDSRTVRRRITLPRRDSEGSNGAPGQLAVGAGAVWAITEGAELVRIDPTTGRVTATVSGRRVRAVAADARSVWAVEADKPTVLRVDPRTATVTARVKLATAQLDAVAVGADAVWITDSYAGVLWRVDPGSRAQSQTIRLEEGADGIAIGHGSVWITNSLRGTLVRVDARTNRIAATVSVGNTPRDVSVGAGAVWVTLGGGSTVVPAAGESAPPMTTSLPRDRCGRVFAGPGPPPERLIVSDLPLQAGPIETAPVSAAIAFVLRRHGFRAGRWRIGYQSCDSSTAESGRSDPRKCSSNARAYAKTRAVIGVIGPLESSCARMQIPTTNMAKPGPLAMISPTNSDVDLTQVDPTAPRGALSRLYPTGVRNYARVHPDATAQTAAAVELARHLRARGVFLLVDGTPYGLQVAHFFRRASRTADLPLAGTARWSPLGTGLGAVADRVAESGADAVFLAGTLGSNGGALTRALRRRLGPAFPVIAPDAFGPVFFLYDESRETARGMYLTTYGQPNEALGERGQRFLTQFAETQHGAPVGGNAVHAAAATEVLLDAIARSDGTRRSVVDRLLATDLRDSAIGPIRFDGNGDLLSPAITVLRVRAREGVSDVEGFEGAAVDRVLRPRG